MDSPGLAEKFFQELAHAGPQPLLARVSGSIRIEVVDGDTCERFRVDVQKGVVKVSRRNARADAVIRIQRALCDDIVTGRENAMAAMLRGELVPEGDLRLVMSFSRVFPGPPKGSR
jgi:putative sterol carrier protein